MKHSTLLLGTQSNVVYASKRQEELMNDEYHSHDDVIRIHVDPSSIIR